MRDRRGYIKLWRKVNAPESSLRSLPGEQRWVAVVCLLEANWQDHTMLSRGQRVPVPRGSFIMSRKTFAEEACGLTVQTVRTAITNLRKLDFLTSTSTNRFTHIYITNYDYWQGDDDESNQPINQEPTNSQPIANQELTTIKEGKKGKKGKKTDLVAPSGSTHGPSKTKRQQPAEAYRLADLLADHIRRRLSDNREVSAKRWAKTRENWANDIRLMNTEDNRCWDNITAAIDWSQADQFYQTIVLSGKSLRKQYDAMKARRKANADRAATPRHRDESIAPTKILGGS